MEHYFLSKAITNLKPNAAWVVRGDNLEWNDPDDAPPTEQELQTEIDRLRAEHEATQYQRDREMEYPPIAVLADALYWSNQGDNTKLDEYYAACAAVKAKYPKPEVN